ncbi:MAG: ABC transporter substrate-binding protein, partial [Hyphomicrobiales bacterium]|nr:ABC transporter substrate-binding protein [Hyphomicrobiales bacterium]
MVGCVALGVAGCNSSSSVMPVPAPDFSAAPVSPVQSQPLAGPTAQAGPTVGETLGAGPVRVGLILPMTQNGAPSAIGASLRNAAQLAIEESGPNDVTVMIMDDHSTPDGAAQAAQAEINAGAEIILGPLLASDVREVGR